MSFNIAVAGKGGNGKTSIASLVIRYLKNNGCGTVLAVDADPNSNLGESLGMEVYDTIGSILAEFQKEKMSIPPGMTKQAYLDVRLNQSISEGKGIDLITMGRGEGQACYCYPNSVLRKFLDTMAGNYQYTVMDNEAGMEHLSRTTTQNVDELLLVAGHSIKGVRAIARIRDFAKDLRLVIKHEAVILNSIPGEIPPEIKTELDKLGLTVQAGIPLEPAINEYDMQLKPLLELPDSSPAVKAVNELMDNLLKRKQTGIP
jgi:CO dehydrogenase maturation factor